MKFENLCGHSVDFQIEKVTQFPIVDIGFANLLYCSITGYFGKHRYTEEDLKPYGGTLPILRTNKGEEISRGRFVSIGISSCEDVDKALAFQKDSVVMQYHKQKMESLDIQREIDILEYHYNVIVEQIRNLYFQNTLVHIEDIVVNSDFVLQKAIAPFVSKNYSPYEKLNELLDLISQLHIKEDYLLYLQHAETYLTSQECEVLKKKALDIPQVYIVVASQQPKFFSYELVEKIQFLYKWKVEQLPPLYIMLDKVNSNIKKNTEITSVELVEFLKEYSFFLIKSKKIETDIGILILESLLEKNKIRNFSILDMETSIII